MPKNQSKIERMMTPYLNESDAEAANLVGTNR